MAARRRIPVVARSSTLAIRQRHTLPQTLILFVTARCNARCDFCLYKESVEHPTRRSEELTVEEYDRIARSYGPLHYLALSGGEPFVRRDVHDLCQAFVDHGGTSVVEIPSNFSYGDAMVDAVTQLVSANPDLVVELQVSIDDLGDRHDESRRVEGLYRAAVDNARRLSELRRAHPNLVLKANVVWLPSNRDRIDQVVAGVRADFDVDRVHLTYPHLRIPADGAGADTVADFARFREVADRVVAGTGSRWDPYTLPMRAAKLASNRMLGAAIAGERPLGERCEAGRHVVVVDERGEVFPCEVIWESVGNVRDAGHDVAAVLAGDRYERFRERYLGADPCNCTWSCASMTSVSVSPEGYPGLALDAARLALGRPARP
ncbi:MAG: radical SAM/SPASM domain-containing protein [Microthrixaceae bacterium]